MKKSLLAVAIAAAVPAVATAQVTIFGIMDAGYFVNEEKNIKGAGVTVTTSTTGGNASGALASNRLGFRGTEKIGDLTAGFHYELGMDAGNTGDLSTTGGVRKSTVSLGGSFGTIEAGRNYTPIFNVSCALDAFRCSNINVGKTVYLQFATTRDSGQIQYTLPTMGGFTLSGSFASNVVEETGKADTGADAVGLSAVYAAGPLALRAGWAKREAKGGDERQELVVGGSYAVTKQLNVLASFGDQEINGSNGAKKSARNAFQIGAQYMITGNTEVIGQFGSRDEEVFSATGAKTTTEVTGFNIGAIQSLSKRTRLYALYGADEWKTPNVATRERMQFAFGVNHSF